ncbi:MAG: hypothetical protein CML66_25765 [Rhodobacteraceae bacterium]|nr:hypothetical protein [Paracoccaceae bacterium]MAY44669.1 hypothetical protein [Paracoccaceae bacterium]
MTDKLIQEAEARAKRLKKLAHMGKPVSFGELIKAHETIGSLCAELGRLRADVSFWKETAIVETSARCSLQDAPAKKDDGNG